MEYARTLSRPVQHISKRRATSSWSSRPRNSRDFAEELIGLPSAQRLRASPSLQSLSSERASAQVVAAPGRSCHAQSRLDAAVSSLSWRESGGRVKDGGRSPIDGVRSVLPVRWTDPQLLVVNDVFRRGIHDAGMSGGCSWRPFEITQSEWGEVAGALHARHAEDRCQFVEPPEWVQTFDDWSSWILIFKHGVPGGVQAPERESRVLERAHRQPRRMVVMDLAEALRRARMRPTENSPDFVMKHRRKKRVAGLPCGRAKSRSPGARRDELEATSPGAPSSTAPFFFSGRWRSSGWPAEASSSGSACGSRSGFFRRRLSAAPDPLLASLDRRARCGSASPGPCGKRRAGAPRRTRDAILFDESEDEGPIVFVLTDAGETLVFLGQDLARDVAHGFPWGSSRPRVRGLGSLLRSDVWAGRFRRRPEAATIARPVQHLGLLIRASAWHRLQLPFDHVRRSA